MKKDTLSVLFAMKIRYDFVTNSSSSCFVICKYNENNFVKIKKDITLGKDGETEFSQCTNICSDFYSRLNFIALQALSFSDEYVNILNNVFYEVTGHKLKWELLEYMSRNYDAYIDHQSIQDECAEKLFKNKVLLKNFIFGKNSKVFMGTDGEYNEYTENLIKKSVYDKDFFASGSVYGGEKENVIMGCFID